MLKQRYILVLAFLLALILAGAMGDLSVADVVPRMPKEELKELIGNSDLVVLDVRTGSDWSGSKYKIRGAVRENPGEFASRMAKYPRDETIVLYCA
jgi:hypothetical protein